jgi:tRNA G18 (ribose-2'-O)-methylase SpoU
MTSAVAQVSQGGFSKVPLFCVTNINKALNHFKENDFWITSFENNIEAKNWYSIDLKGRSVLIFGGEGNGVSKQILKNSDFLATIPMSNKMNSLNVSTAVSAIVFERLRQVLS